MNKRVIIIVLIILIGGGAVYGLTAGKKNKNDTTTQNTGSSNTSQTQTNQNTAATNTPASNSSVSIENFAFSPSDITVKKGTTVTWTNNDSTVHTVTEIDSQNGPKSQQLNQGDKYTFTFDQAGTFHYKCSIHPYMLGSVTVTE